jgi:hypothetical protein
MILTLLFNYMHHMFPSVAISLTSKLDINWLVGVLVDV